MKAAVALLFLLLGAGWAQADDMIEVRYNEQDPGHLPYLTRMLVTPDFLRMDGGADDDDFVLLDRKARELFNVMRGNNMAMRFVPGKLPPRPQPWTVVNTVEPGAQGTQRYVLQVNGKQCVEGVAARAAQPDAARAMAEVKSVLAATQYGVWLSSPPELQHDCDLANLVWEFERTLELGLPLEEQDFTGRRRELEFEGRVPLRPELFLLPPGTAVLEAPSQPGL
jgi:hypothetical protein